ncbi:hypothetical protein Gpo141_00013892 [Globisporangium polare]
MQFTLLLAAATVAAVAAYDETTPCPSSELTKLAPVALNPALITCQDASGWQMLPPTGYPTDAQRALMCAEPACFTLIAAVNATKPADCLLVFSDVSLNVKKLVDTFEPLCFA